MRKACLNCVYKHLADAAVWEIEYHLGYPGFKLYIAGSLNHASHEAYAADKELAWLLRQHRINWCAAPDTYVVPYESMAAFIDICAKMPVGAPLPAIPEECYAGIVRDSEGKPRYDADTRPA